MGRYFVEEASGERTLYYQPYEGESLIEQYFEGSFLGETEGVVAARKVAHRTGLAVAYEIQGMLTLEQILVNGVEEEELIKILVALAETAEAIKGAGVPSERLLFHANCVMATEEAGEVFYVVHTGSFPLQGISFFAFVKKLLEIVQINSVQYGIDKMVESYLEEQRNPSVLDFAQYLKNIRHQLFETKQYSGQQSLSCRLGDDDIVIDELFSIEAPKFSTIRMMEQESEKKRAFLLRVGTGERIEITKAVFTIGKEEGADYQVLDNSAISRKHASIIFRDNEYRIKDLDSTNHTFVNRRLIRSPEEIRLEPGASVLLANEMFLYEEE